MLRLIALVAMEDRRPSADELRDVWVPVLLLATWLGAVGLAVGLARRSRLVRRAAVALVALVALASLARAAADAWGAAPLRSIAQSVDLELAAERQRMAAARSPVLREPVLEEDAYPRYRALMSQVEGAGDLATLGTGVAAGPGPRLEPGCRRLLEQHREVVRGCAKRFTATAASGGRSWRPRRGGPEPPASPDPRVPSGR